jgi:quinol monooxygenase YgiN
MVSIKAALNNVFKAIGASQLADAENGYANIPPNAYSVFAEVYAKPGKEDELRAATLPLIALVRRDTKNLLHFLQEDREVPGHFIFYEVYAISFFPFSAAVLAKYMTTPQQQQTAVILYALSLFLAVLMWLLMWLYASHHNRLLDRDLDSRFVRYLTRKYILTAVVYFLAFALSLWNGIAGLELCVGLTLLYALPQKNQSTIAV